jgi:hypothetical protein
MGIQIQGLRQAQTDKVFDRLRLTFVFIIDFTKRIEIFIFKTVQKKTFLPFLIAPHFGVALPLLCPKII